MTELPSILRSGDFLKGVKNPRYQLSEDNLTYKKTFFAFIDILGFRSFVSNSGSSAPKTVFSIMKSFVTQHAALYESVNVKILSDSILVWGDSSDPVMFWNILNVVGLIREILLGLNLFTRGGISFGDSFIHEDVIVSPALIEAYELERSANVPRILIAPCALELAVRDIKVDSLGNYGLVIENHFRKCPFETLQTDEDGRTALWPYQMTDGLHFLIHARPGSAFPGDAPATPEQMETYRRQGLEDLARYREKFSRLRDDAGKNTKLIEKFNYLAKKFNRFTATHELAQDLEELKLFS